MPANADDVRRIDLNNEFADISDEDIECVLKEAACFIGDKWGEKAELGCTLIAAHLLAVRAQGSSGPAGPVTAESAGGLARSYGWSGGPRDSWWASTSYGNEYLMLKKTLACSPTVATVCPLW